MGLAPAHFLYSTTVKGETAAAGDDYLNLKLGVDVGGLIDNTTLSVIWETKNILNDYSYGDGVGDVARFGPKLGTLNFKAKIAL